MASELMEREQSLARRLERRNLAQEDGDDVESSDGEESRLKQPKKSQPAIPGICCVCGATETPQWRSGPGGLNTLCNGCGIRWRKGRLVIDGETNPAAKRTATVKKKTAVDSKPKDKSPKSTAQRSRLSTRVLPMGEDTNGSSDEEASEVEVMKSSRQDRKRRRQVGIVLPSSGSPSESALESCLLPTHRTQFIGLLLCSTGKMMSCTTPTSSST